MRKINDEYLKDLFGYLDKHEEINVPHKTKPSDGYAEIHRALGNLFDDVCTYADSDEVGIDEFIGRENGADNRFYYFVGYKGKVFEFGMYFDHNIVYIHEVANGYNPEDVIDCEAVVKSDAIKTKKGKRILIFEPQNGNDKKEDK